jgi:hypothetical protein
LRWRPGRKGRTRPTTLDRPTPPLPARSYRMPLTGSLEDDGAAAVDEDAVFEVPPDCAGENPPLDLAAEAHEVFDGVAVGDVGDVLVDDRTCVELLGHVVGGRAYGLHAPLVRPPVGVGPPRRPGGKSGGC